MQLYLYPAKVQGEGAAATIKAGIEKLDTMGLDTIIIGRGGGSIEDLWPFNEECVARAIYNAKTPIISGTYHEIDNTIADYAADLRAPTPSAACELALPDVMSLLYQVRQFETAMTQSMKKHILQEQKHIQMLSARLEKNSPKMKFENQKIYLDSLQDRICLAGKGKYEKKRHQYEILLAKLNGLSPTAKLVGGYGYIETEDNAAIKSVTDIKENDKISVRIWDGTIEGVVTNIEKMEKING